MVDHAGVRHIAGDVYHMLVGEDHISSTILEYGGMMTNLHLADRHRMALGIGILDLDIIIMALYTVGYNNEKCFILA
jgi:sugar phosphate isomerase/epimerase